MKRKYVPILLILILQGCIGTDIVEDFVEPRVVIDNPISSLKVDDMYQFEAIYLDNIGAPSPAVFQWKSSNEEVLTINVDGYATGVSEGESTVTASNNGVSDSLVVMVTDTTIVIQIGRVAELQTVSSYPLSGKATLKKQSGKTILEFDESFSTTSALPGLYVYLTNNVSTINNALEVAKVKAFTGAQSYEITEDISLTEYDYVLFYCKPFLVPVGDGELKP